MEISSLGEFAAKRMEAGVSRAEVREELIAVGWSEGEADAAFRDGAVRLGAPVPAAGRQTSGRKSSTVDIILNLFSFILLGILIFALGALFFRIVDRYFPDPLVSTGVSRRRAISEAIHYAIAALVVAFPLYAAVMRVWFRRFRTDDVLTESRLSKWITYLVLLAASVTIVGDLISVFFTALQGELSVRFFLKALTVLVIAAGIFGFYFFERRTIQYRRDVPPKLFRTFGISVATVIVFGIVVGFFAGGSPETSRDASFDERRSENLLDISNCVGQYAREYGGLPGSLSELSRTSGFVYCSSSFRDPETGAEYEYRIVHERRVRDGVAVGEYELCATFALPADLSGGNGRYGVANDIWSVHRAGRECDTATAQLGELAPVPAEKTAPNMPESSD